MGKPFAEELSLLSETYAWATNASVDPLEIFLDRCSASPLFVLGSGGSYSAAAYMAALVRGQGSTAYVLTPLEFVQENIPHNSGVLLASAGGGNADVLGAYRYAVEKDVRHVAGFCLASGTKLGKLMATKHVGTIIEMSPPYGKDGFLSTNSLLAYLVLMARASGWDSLTWPNELPSAQRVGTEEDLQQFFHCQYVSALYSSFSSFAAMDFESKCSEAALSSVQLADYRNFAHGRHHWLAKRSDETAVLAMVTPEDETLSQETLALLPARIPRLVLRTDHKGPLGTVALFRTMLEVVQELGLARGIDPGRPGVPSFGRKIYRLNLRGKKLIGKSPSKKEATAAVHQARKLAELRQGSGHQDAEEQVSEAYTKFLTRLTRERFHSVVFDYDGTLVNSAERFCGPRQAIKDHLLSLLDHGITVCIATGRGKSVRKDFSAFVPKKKQAQVIIGYYNGSQVHPLSEERYPDVERKADPQLERLESEVRKYSWLVGQADIQLRPDQLTVVAHSVRTTTILGAVLRNLLVTHQLNNLKVFISGHSIDILPSQVSKLALVRRCQEKARAHNLRGEVLCIGDRGRWPGNDVEFLSTRFSLSVDEVSACLNSCWSLSAPGVHEVEACLHYLSAMKLFDGYFAFQRNKLV